ncbi:MAG: hypothetical protein GY832_45360 [Chloroflexi bacterium]|nr:hypothetical protein [Chloroflexota bacterium]
MYWNGDQWDELEDSAHNGGISNNSGDSNRASVTIGPKDKPYVVWHDSSDGDTEIYARRWE